MESDSAINLFFNLDLGRLETFASSFDDAFKIENSDVSNAFDNFDSWGVSDESEDLGLFKSGDWLIDVREDVSGCVFESSSSLSSFKHLPLDFSSGLQTDSLKCLNCTKELVSAEESYDSLLRDETSTIENQKEAYRRFKSLQYRLKVKPRLHFKKRRITVEKLHKIAVERPRLKGRFITREKP
jgi:hypothetical protein